MSEPNISQESVTEQTSAATSELASEAETEPEQEAVHTHRRKSRLKPVLYFGLSFFLAFTLFLLSVCTVLFFTVFSKDYILGIVRSDKYQNMVRSELKSCMEDLVDASGFEKAFADRFVDELDIEKDLTKYISSYYIGDNTLVDTTAFKQNLYSAIDVYVKEKNIGVTQETKKNIAYFVNEATKIYVTQISIPFFSTMANYVYKLKTAFIITTASLAVFAIIMICIIWFTNRYKHRRFRYLFYGAAGGFLAVVILPTVVLMSGKTRKVNFLSRSLYNLFVDYFNGLFYSFYIPAGILFLSSLCFFLQYLKHYRRVRNR